MQIDVIICTYNRPSKVVELINQLLICKQIDSKIIIVDSSDDENYQLKNNTSIYYHRSSHKNQPYQRYLGFLNSKADFILYLDDDMELVTNNLFEILNEQLKNKNNISGLALHFEDKHNNTTLANIPTSELINSKSYFKKFIRWITCYPVLDDGVLGLCGNRGQQPNFGGKTQWLSGGAFLAKRQAMFQNFNFQLFDLFEQRLGMGEDAIIGYGLSKQGDLIYYPKLLFYHDDQRDSTYSLNQFEFAKKVIYSRLYLSLEKNRLDKKGIIYPTIYFHWYAICRIVGLLLNYIKSPNTNRKLVLKGTLVGWKKSLFFRLKENQDYWHKEAQLNNLHNWQ